MAPRKVSADAHTPMNGGEPPHSFADSESLAVNTNPIRTPKLVQESNLKLQTNPPPTTSSLQPVKALLWFVVGGVVGLVVGVVIFRLAADPTDGWADLTSLFGSLFTYGPVGALSGLALARRKQPWPWAKMAIAGLVLALIPVLFLDGSTVTTWGLAAYGLFVGAAAAWWLGHRDAGKQSFG